MSIYLYCKMYKLLYDFFFNTLFCKSQIRFCLRASIVQWRTHETNTPSGITIWQHHGWDESKLSCIIRRFEALLRVRWGREEGVGVGGTLLGGGVEGVGTR